MALLQRIPPVQEQAIATFDFTDIAEGTGVVLLNGFTTKEETTATHRLQSNSIYSNDIETTATVTSTQSQKKLDLDFDLSQYNLPKIIKGTGILNISFAIKASSGGQFAVAFIIAKVVHVVNSTEIVLATARSETLTSPASADAIKSKTVCLKLSLTEKHFKKGEILRLIIEGWAASGGATGQDKTLYIAHDPQNRDGDGVKPSSDSPKTTSKLELYIPFRIDL